MFNVVFLNKPVLSTFTWLI
uniref:Uncharacterized protein n=1 Tax=Rhizophora mucronata TaxID=61149 RepID=A0A2P2P2L7_RHIMU